MSIKTRLLLLVLLPILFGVASFALYLWNIQKLSTAEREQEVSQTIIRHALELELLINDFIRHPDEKRIREQWMDKHKRVGIYLSRTDVTPENQDAFDHLHLLFTDLRQLFVNKVWSLRSAEVTGKKEYYRDEKTLDIMLLTTHQLMMESLAFGKKTAQKARGLRDTTDTLILILNAGLSLLLGLLALFIGHRIQSSISTLKKGSRIIGEGNLRFRFSGLGNDEIGDLGNAFNLMTEKLDRITASRDELNREIAERKEAEKQLSENRAYLRKILDTQSSIVVINMEGHLIDTNKAFFKFLPQYDSVESFRREHNCICELFEAIERPGFLKAQMGERSWIDYLHDEPEVLHKAMIRSQGKEHIFSVRYEPVELEGGRHNIISFSDITELENYQQHLEEQIRVEVDKRREKENQMLRQSRIAQMGEMITNISHHWRQPLNIIGLNVQELRDAQQFGELTEEHLNETVRDTMKLLTKMSATLDQFREFVAKPQEKSHFLLAEAVRKTADLIRPALGTHFIGLETELDDSLRVFGDQQLLEQALYNILHNAQEALEERGKGEKVIRIALAKGDDGTARLTVTDTGGGIDEGVMPRIFEPFFTTKERANKTGTGLYFAKTLIEAEHGGRIDADNTADGARFTITLPLDYAS